MAISLPSRRSGHVSRSGGGASDRPGLQQNRLEADRTRCVRLRNCLRAVHSRRRFARAARLMRHGASWGPNCNIPGPMREAIPSRLRLLCVKNWPMIWSRHPRNRQTDDAFSLGIKLAMNQTCQTTYLPRGNSEHSQVQYSFRGGVISIRLAGFGTKSGECWDKEKQMLGCGCVLTAGSPRSQVRDRWKSGENQKLEWKETIQLFPSRQPHPAWKADPKPSRSPDNRRLLGKPNCVNCA